MDEAYIEMRCYIKYNLYYGQGEQTIRQNLINAGWPVDKINQAFGELKGIVQKKEVKKAPVQKLKTAAPKVQAENKKAPKAEKMPEAPIASPAPSRK